MSAPTNPPTPTNSAADRANDEPPYVHQISAPELKAWMDDGTPFVLIDVRTEEEHEIARIDGARLLDRAAYEHLLTLDRDTTIVFQCHHGIRSQHAAQHCLGEGFRRLYNLEGGIDAWSALVDPSVPRY